MALIGTLTDDFATKNTTKWAWPGTETVSGGVASIPCSTTYDEVVSQAAYDLTGSSLCVQLVGVPTGSGEVIFTLTTTQYSVDNVVGFWITNGYILPVEQVGGTWDDGSTGDTFNAAIHKWLRIRHASGTVYWEYSTDGLTWTVLRSKTPGITITALYASLSTGVSSGTAGSLSFDNVNLPPSAVVAGKGSFFPFVASPSGGGGGGGGGDTAPQALLEWMDPQWFVTGTGTKTVTGASDYFSGDSLTYSLVSPPVGVTINSATGVVSVNTATGFEWTEVVVRATNGLGSADVELPLWVFTPSVTVAANASLPSTPPSAGGIVVVRGGTITTQQDVSSWAGSKSAPIRVVAYPGENVEIDCVAIANHAINLSGAQYVEFYGFEFSDDGTHNFAIWNDTQDGCALVANRFHDFWMTAFAIGQGTGTKADSGVWRIEYNRIWNNVRQNDNLDFEEAGCAATMEYAQADGSTKSYIIRRNRSWNNWGEGLGILASNGFAVEQNIVWDNASVGIYMDNCRDGEVHGNRVWATDPAFFSVNGGAPGIGPSSSIRAGNEDYNGNEGITSGGREQLTNGLNVTGNYVLDTNTQPEYLAYQDGFDDGDSVWSPNYTFTESEIQDVWK